MKEYNIKTVTLADLKDEWLSPHAFKDEYDRVEDELFRIQHDDKLDPLPRTPELNARIDALLKRQDELDEIIQAAYEM